MINIEHRDINASISVDVYNTDRFKSESISVYFRLPKSKEDSPVRALLLGVIKRGCERYRTQLELNRRLDELYATAVVTESRKYEKEHLIGISADVIKKEYTEDGCDLLKEALEVILQMLFEPLLDGEGCFLDEHVSREKLNYKRSILSQINEPRSYAAIRCREETFSDLDLGYKLSEMCDVIDGISTRRLTEHYKKMLISPSFEVFYVGERSADEVSGYVGDALRRYSADKASVFVGDLSMIEKRAEHREISENKEASQSRLAMSFSCGVNIRHKDYYTMLLLNEILGASPISKLMMNVREAMGLCYECSCAYDASHGALFVYSGVEASELDVAREAILDQIKAISAGDVSEKEMQAAKKSLTNVYNGINDSPSAIERFCLGGIINGANDSIEDAISRISDVSVSDVARVAQGLSLHTDYTLVGTLDAKEGEDE